MIGKSDTRRAFATYALRRLDDWNALAAHLNPIHSPQVCMNASAYQGFLNHVHCVAVLGAVLSEGCTIYSIASGLTWTAVFLFYVAVHMPY
jgi:hypothetical protein